MADQAPAKCGFRWQDTKSHWCELTEPHEKHECWVCRTSPPDDYRPVVLL